jgi:hypothetical protein
MGVSLPYSRAIEPCRTGIRAGRRAAPRLRLSIPARIVTRYDTRNCILIDLSCTGARVGLEAPLRKGDAGLLQVGGIEPFAEIVRVLHGEAGGVNGLFFDPPLHESDVLSIRAFSERYHADEQRALREEVRRWVSGARS